MLGTVKQFVQHRAAHAMTIMVRERMGGSGEPNARPDLNVRREEMTRPVEPLAVFEG
jgi:hypothetical protein